MFTIEWQTTDSPSYRWTKSVKSYDSHVAAAQAGAQWMTTSHEHGVEIQFRVIAADRDEPKMAEAA